MTDVTTFDVLSDSQLRVMVQQDAELSQAIFLANPLFARDAAWEPFSEEWVKRYAKAVLTAISGKPVDEALKWALALTGADLANFLIAHFGISAASYPAAVALSILLIRAMIAAQKKQ